jgi:hypothetical protein
MPLPLAPGWNACPLLLLLLPPLLPKPFAAPSCCCRLRLRASSFSSGSSLLE